MNTGWGRVTIVAAVFLMLAITQVYFGLSFAMANPRTEPLEPGPPPITAILMTRGNRPITVNGGNALSGTTILTGSIIETPEPGGRRN